MPYSIPNDNAWQELTHLAAIENTRRHSKPCGRCQQDIIWRKRNRKTVCLNLDFTLHQCPPSARGKKIKTRNIQARELKQEQDSGFEAAIRE